AVIAIVVVHELPMVRGWFLPREEGRAMRLLRSLGGLVMTGLAVEIALMPFSIYHFHRAGLYGVGANIVAIPLTTFLIMPAEALALLFEPLGIAAPFWWAAGWSIDLLLGIAHWVASSRGAVLTLPTIPTWA